MKATKKLLSLVLCLAMLLSVCNVGIFAEEETAEKAVDISEDMFAENAEEKPELQSEVAAGQNFLAASDSGTCGKNLTWTLDEGGTLTISGTGAMGDYSYNAMPWYDYRNSIKTAVIEDGVTSIGYMAFEDCYSLASVTIPDSVTSIGDRAFYDCDSLASVTIPDSVTSIGNYAFSRCYSLKSMNIPDSVTSIGGSAFSYCSALTDVYYTGTEEQWKAIFIGKYNDPLINANIYYDCTVPVSSVSLNNTELNLEIGESETLIATILPEDATYKNLVWSSSDKSVAVVSDGVVTAIAPGSAVIIAVASFGNKSATCVVTVTKPDNILAYGTCGEMLVWTLDVNGTLTVSGTGAMGDYFYGDMPWYDYRNSVKTVIIEDGVTSIGNYAFYDCDSLESVTIGNSVTSIGGSAFNDCDSLESVTIGNSVTSIGGRAFCNCYSLASVTIPDSVTSIADEAFSNCSNLVKVTIGDSVTSIGNDAFSYCISLVVATLGNSVTSIGNYAFSQCYSLKSMNIPDSVTSIGERAFYSCDSLGGIWVGENNESYSSDEKGVLFNKDKTTLIQYPIGRNENSYDIYDSVTSIGVDAFYSCDSLESVTIPDSVTSIGNYAFYDCDSLESVTIGNSVTSIGNYAFYSCDILASVTIGNSVTSIGGRAFCNCYRLKSVNIPDSVTSIGESAFYNCCSLESVTIGNGVTSIDKNAFSACYSLESVIIPASLTSLAYGVFANCSSLTDVYYTGTEEQWKAILVGAENDSLLNARIHYNYDSSVVAAGDANGDGVIDIKDAVLLAQHLAGWSVSIDENAADCNGDGKVDIKDAVLLAQYLAGWNVTLG